MEIWDGITIEASGSLIIRVHRAKSNLYGHRILLKDPLQVVIFQRTIPEIIKGEYWQITFPITNYLMHGSHKIEVKNDDKDEVYSLEFKIASRRKASQVFLFETNWKITNLRKGAKSLTLRYHKVPDNFLLQKHGEEIIRGASYDGDRQLISDVTAMTQKTISLQVPIQPSYMPIDFRSLHDQPDEYYIFNTLEFDDEPGIEVSHPELENYGGTRDITYPFKVLHDVLNHVHRNMRYVRQKKERGVSYALKFQRGDCTEYSAFVTAMLRKLGINARMVSGMGRSLHNYWIPHAFVEVFIHGAWIPVDTVKPPKPYLQVGNRGELIGLHRNNWLDSSFKDHQIQFMAYKGVNPKLVVSQKVTESGLKRLNKQMSNHKPRNKLLALFSKDEQTEIIKNESVITIFHPYDDANSILLIAGEIDFGKIIYMKFVNNQPIKIDLPGDIAKNTDYLVILDKWGNAKDIEPVNFG